MSDRIRDSRGKGQELLDEGYSLLGKIEQMSTDKAQIDLWSETIVDFFNRVRESKLGPQTLDNQHSLPEIVVIQALLDMSKPETTG